MKTIRLEELTSLYVRIAEALGASAEEAEIFARCMARADLRGMFTQGASMIPYSVELIQKGIAKFGVPLEVIREEPGMILADGHLGVGVVTGTWAMELAINKARQAGVGCVWVKNGGDFMMTANHVLQAVEQDMVGIVVRNEAARVAPWGGMEPFFFTNPIAVGIPAAEEPPIVIDMAAGSFSVGVTVMAARDGQRMPSAHLVTEDGRYTDDPREIVVDPMNRESPLRGAIVTLGHKGLAWALIVELLSGLLAGTNTSNQNDFKPSADRPWSEAQFHMAIDVSKLRPVDEFKSATDDFIRSLRSVKPAQGFEGVVVPGEIEAKNEQQRRREGVPIREEVGEQVVEVADSLGVSVEG